MERINSNVSTETNFDIIHLKNISRDISFYISLFYLIIGNIGAILSIPFFLQKPPRKCPCIPYILVTTISNFIILNNNPILKLLSGIYSSKKWIYISIAYPILSRGVNDDLWVFSRETVRICQIRNYLHMWSTDVAILMLLFASMNRYFTSLKKLNQLTSRRLSNIFCSFSHAIMIGVGSSVLWALISFHHYYNSTIVSQFCVPKHLILWAIWICVVHCLIPAICMIFFSTLTLINLRKNSKSPRYSHGNNYEKTYRFSTRDQNVRDHRSHRHYIEHQLTAMIIIETIITTLTTAPYAVYVMYQAITKEHEKSTKLLAREDLIEQSIRLTMYFEPSCGFYVYLFTLKTLRKRFLRILLQKIKFF